MAEVVYAVLAHDRPDTLAEFVSNVRDFSETADIVVFNGGSLADLTAGIDVEVCPTSRPLTYGHLTPFHLEVMRWLRPRPWDFVVTLESDMALLKPGYEPFIQERMRDSGYMGARLRVCPDPGWGPWKEMAPVWDTWAAALGAARALGAFNPGQVFRRDFAERLLSWDRLPLAEEMLATTSRPLLEEIFFATAADVLAANPADNPGSRAYSMHPYAPEEIDDFIDDPDVFFIHKARSDVDSVDRQMVRALRQGRRLDPSGLPRPEPPRGRRKPVTRELRRRLRFLRRSRSRNPW